MNCDIVAFYICLQDIQQLQSKLEAKERELAELNALLEMQSDQESINELRAENAEVSIAQVYPELQPNDSLNQATNDISMALRNQLPSPLPNHGSKKMKIDLEEGSILDTIVNQSKDGTSIFPDSEGALYELIERELFCLSKDLAFEADPFTSEDDGQEPYLPAASDVDFKVERLLEAFTESASSSPVMPKASDLSAVCSIIHDSPSQPVPNAISEAYYDPPRKDETDTYLPNSVGQKKLNLSQDIHLHSETKDVIPATFPSSQQNDGSLHTDMGSQLCSLVEMSFNLVEMSFKDDSQCSAEVSTIQDSVPLPVQGDIRVGPTALHGSVQSFSLLAAEESGSPKNEERELQNERITAETTANLLPPPVSVLEVNDCTNRKSSTWRLIEESKALLTTIKASHKNAVVSEQPVEKDGMSESSEPLVKKSKMLPSFGPSLSQFNVTEEGGKYDTENSRARSKRRQPTEFWSPTKDKRKRLSFKKGDTPRQDSVPHSFEGELSRKTLDDISQCTSTPGTPLASRVLERGYQSVIQASSERKKQFSLVASGLKIHLMVRPTYVLNISTESV